MWGVWAMRVLRNYAPAITLPFAAVVGYIGYKIESNFSRYTPYTDSIKESRNDRLLDDKVLEQATTNKKLSYGEKILDRNISPSLKTSS